MINKWIGVDLDGTLAFHEQGSYTGGTYIGEPIPRMVHLVKNLIDTGETIKIFTARADRRLDEPEVISAIESWCLVHLGKVLEVTNIKDRYCKKIYDDKAVTVLMNTGITVNLV
jgi:hypothetical protein